LQSLGKRLKEIWEGEGTTGASGALAAALRLLSFPYGAAVALRNRLYDRGILRQERLPRPVISLGNLTVGGTGKTPTVILLANLLREKGRRPAVLSRGYGGRAKAAVNIVSDGTRILMGWREAGDEPVLIAKAAPGVPVLTGPKRVLTGRAAVESFGADCLILDDAFQHRALCRDLDIVLLDAARPFGNGFLLPRGPLRETPEALGRAHLLLRTGGAEEEEPLYEPAALGRAGLTLRREATDDLEASSGALPPLPFFRGIHRPLCLVEADTGRLLPLSELRDRRVFAFAGIAHPEAFLETLTALGAQVVSFQAFPDHHPYSPSDIADIRRFAKADGAERIITTEKDGIRLADFPDFLPDISLLRIGMKISPAEPFAELIFSALAY
jgi:tetraacyldisaccharide 4'-kinase